MKCPNCGAWMGEGRLYCESCGQDIHIVPDFEPELERNLEKSLEHILEDVAQTDNPDKTETVKRDDKDKPGNPWKKLWPMAGWLGMGILVLVLIVGGVKVFHYYSLDYQVEQAKKLALSQQYEQAIRHYARAMELDEFNVDLKIGLAEVYFLKNDKVKYESMLRDIVTDPNTDSEQLESAYGKLIAVYRAREDYQTINDMLLACESDSVRTVYQSYMAEPPQFSVPAGDYDEVKALKLTVTGKGTIYYTVNGGIPDEDCEYYTTPILLESGDYVVRAVFVNDNGVASETAEAAYHVLVEELEPPIINVDGGDYDMPVLITVLNDSDNVYYTTDGTTPTMDSARYIEPIPMPLGVSDFRFVRLETGRASAVVERIFVFELDTDLTPEQAVDKVRKNAIHSGKIMDEDGHFDDTAACYRYQYLYVANINDINAFYVVAEVFVDAQGIAARTGNYFAVNAYSGYYYKLQMEDGEYRLIEI